MKYLSWLIVLGCTALPVGCASQKVALPQKFWHSTDTKVAVVLTEIPDGANIYHVGPQGVIDYVVTRLVEQITVEQFMKSIKADRFCQIAEIFEKELSGAGFDVIDWPEQVDIGNMPKFEGRGKEFYRYDLSQIFEQTDADTIVLLQLIGYGAHQAYFGTTPAGEPQAVAVVRGVMVDKANNQILWDSGRKNGEIRERMKGYWIEGSSEPYLVAAIHRAIERSKSFLARDFFEDHLSSSTLSLFEKALAQLDVPEGIDPILTKYTEDMQTIGAGSIAFTKPYKFTQDHSYWWGPKRKIRIDEVEAKVAATEDGKVVYLFGPKLGHRRYTEYTARAFAAVARFFEENGVGIERVIGITMKRHIFGYFLELDSDGYSLLREHTIK